MTHCFSFKRALARAIVTTQVLAGMAVLVAQQPTPSPTASASRDAGSESKKREPNRTVPAVTPPNLAVDFGDAPAVASLMSARVLPEPLAPVGRAPSLDENRSVARALEAFAADPSAAGVTALEEFVTAHPASPWRAAVLNNVGLLRWRQGYFSRAAGDWLQAWNLAKDATDPSARAVADFAIGEWLTQATSFGQVEGLQQRLKEIEKRTVRGAAGNKVKGAQEGLAFLVNDHVGALFSGPEALKVLLPLMGRQNRKATEAIAAYHPAHRGTSLADLRDLATRAGVPMTMRFQAAPVDVPVPSIVHLKSQHYSAVIARQANGFVLRDVALGGEMVVSAEALRDEASGFVLVPASAPSFGRAATLPEAQNVLGHCLPGAPYDDEPCDCAGPSLGMPGYALHPLTAAVLVSDTPVSYMPARGPAVSLRLRYNQRTGRVNQTPTYGNLGPLWTGDWLSYVQDNNFMITAPYTWTSVVLRGEGMEIYTPNSGFTHWKTHATLEQVSSDPPRYERRLPDGTVEVYTLPDRAATLPSRKIFLTELIDPQGQTLTYTYDSSVRLVALTDAVGLVTTFDYEDATHPLLLTKITDPFGRTATVTYDSGGRVETLTDAIGLTSRFDYAPDDVMISMTTPYGLTQFRRGPDGLMGPGNFRRVEVVDPTGGTERIEFHMHNTSLAVAAPAADVPSGFSAWNDDLDWYVSLYWSKKAMAESPGDLSRAVQTKWLMQAEYAYAHPLSRQIPHMIKRPLENRVWYRYPGQSSNNHTVAGTGSQPSLVARVLEGGATQLTQMSYNTLGMLTSKTDPMGRQTTYTYASNGMDVTQVRQTKAGGSDLVASYGNYDSLHLPGTVTDAAGLTTTTTYNAAGQPLTVTNPLSETTTYTYQTGTGYLLSVAGPVTGSTTSYTYDGQGRPQTVTQPDGYVVTTTYDALNRVVSQTYPDDTSDTYVFQRLDLAEQHDRLGRITRHFYDAVGRRTATRDPLGRLIRQEWCGCGSLNALVDANGNRTTWERDVLGRVTREIRADGTTDTLYTYDATGRLKTVTDPKDQVATYTYLADHSLSSTAYTNATVATPTVSYTYDPVYPRLATMVDGTGTTTYTYVAPGTEGAGQVATVDGPLTDDTISYTYDALGRTVARDVHGTGIEWTFDELSRVTTEENVLGTFTYTYDGVTSRLATVTYPNDQTSAYSYRPEDEDSRLQTIHHKYPNGTTLSKFDYTYGPTGNILTWRQQADSDPAVLWKYGYDAADQVVSAVKESTGGSPAILKRYAYAYDPGGNRTSEQIDDALTSATHNNLNRLLTHAPGGLLGFRGSLNEPGTVTIQGRPAAVSSSNTFSGTAPTSPGDNTLTVAAVDSSGNQRSQDYQLNVAGVTGTMTYDANGNLTSDGTRTFEWDARNQLVAVTVGTHRTEFDYNGEQRRVRIVEKENGAIQVERRFLWCAATVCEERDAAGATTVVRFFDRGEQRASPLFLTRDHLDSIREATQSDGIVVGRYDYAPWGEMTVASGTAVTDRGYTNHLMNAASGLLLSPFRPYDASEARWIAEDPLRNKVHEVFASRSGGVSEVASVLLQMYTYAENRPTSRLDRTGLASGPPGGMGDCSNQSPRCNDTYAPCFSYSGTNARCFCKCSDNGAWSSLVRCCLFAAYARGLGNNEAHALCYAGATAVTGVAFIPYDTLYRCYGRCKEEQKKNCTTC